MDYVEEDGVESLTDYEVANKLADMCDLDRVHNGIGAVIEAIYANCETVNEALHVLRVTETALRNITMADK